MKPGDTRDHAGQLQRETDECIQNVRAWAARFLKLHYPGESSESSDEVSNQDDFTEAQNVQQ